MKDPTWGNEFGKHAMRNHKTCRLRCKYPGSQVTPTRKESEKDRNSKFSAQNPREPDGGDYGTILKFRHVQSNLPSSISSCTPAITGCGSGLCSPRPWGRARRRQNGPGPFRTCRWSRFSGCVERGGRKMRRGNMEDRVGISELITTETYGVPHLHFTKNIISGGLTPFMTPFTIAVVLFRGEKPNRSSLKTLDNPDCFRFNC